MKKLNKPLYHGTSNAASTFIIGGYGFTAPVYLTENKQDAEHYAKAATAWLEREAKGEGAKLLADGYAVFTFHSLPNIAYLKIDDYNLDAERGQWIYTKPIRGLGHFTVERYPLDITKEERLRLECFAIGMWRK